MFPLDSALFLWLNATAASPVWLVPLARFASQELPQLLLAGTVGALLVGDKSVQRCVFRLVLAMMMAWLLARLGQLVFQMPRPFNLGMGTMWLAHASSAGFPSTHASVAFAFGGVAAVSTQRWALSVAALAIAALVAWSRVCLGLHFPTDVLAGAAVGGISAWLSGLVPLVAPKIRSAS